MMIEDQTVDTKNKINLQKLKNTGFVHSSW